MIYLINRKNIILNHFNDKTKIKKRIIIKYQALQLIYLKNSKLYKNHRSVC
jgi:hypothetical protein